MEVLPPTFSYDTETGQCPDGLIRTVLIQYCNVNATTPEEVVMIEGEDCFLEFFKRFEETGCPMECHAYNLSYEISWIIPQIRDSYQWVEWNNKKMRPGTFTVMADPMACYAFKICNHRGYVLRMTDDLKRVGNVSMAEASKSVKKQHPEWFVNLPGETKERTSEYNVWYTYEEGDPRKESFRHYARVDAFSQAMIARWIIERGYDISLTSASNGLKMALAIRYQDSESIDNKTKNFYAKKDFNRFYPVLPREMQDLCEDELVGGFVYGDVGDHKGKFFHYDYSSSYPAEYHHGKMFIGRVFKITVESPNWDRVLDAPNYFRWYVCSFDFRIKERGIPAISGKECRTVDTLMNGKWSKKMREGICENKLLTESYLDELTKNYDITNLKIWECWFAKRKSGDFAPFIEKCYAEKSRPELKGTMERHEWKLFMNGGIHGKTITKTHRKKVTYPNGIRTIEKETTAPDYCALIGFTGMMNARERLIRHCRMVREAGFEIYMCDTDSMVTDCPPDEAKRILGNDAFESEDGGINNLGKFEIETFEGKEDFNEFRCWGLKRYLELDHGVYRKSAFAGMHEDIQPKILPTWKTDGTKYEWTQKGSISGPFGKIVTDVIKHGGAENIWNEETSVPFNPCRDGFNRLQDAMMRRYKLILQKYGEERLRDIFADMMVYDEEGIKKRIEEVKKYGS